MDDTSLDEFLDIGESGDEEGGRADTEDPELATAEWRAGGCECERCGVTTFRRWRDDGQMVCDECKPWTETPRTDE